MPSLKKEIAALERSYDTADQTMRDSLVQRKRGTEGHRNMLRALFKNSCARIRALVNAGLLPQDFSIGPKGTGYHYIAVVQGIRTSHAPEAKAEKQPLTEAQREQKKALKVLKQSYQWCRNEMDESLKKANPEAMSYRLFCEYSKDLDTDYLAIRQELGVLPKNLGNAVESGLHYVCYHDSEGGLHCVKVDTKGELDRLREMDKINVLKLQFNTPEDIALRAQFDDELGENIKL